MIRNIKASSTINGLRPKRLEKRDVKLDLKTFEAT
jgi:hypothetical protein